MSLNSKLTIIIPTQDRHRLIKRCIDYYRDFRTNIYIVDSTKNQFVLSDKNYIKYVHLPDLSYQEKIHNILHKIETKYVCICPDDDFLSEESLEQGINFLDQNKDFTFVQGLIVRFNVYFKKFVLTNAIQLNHQKYINEESTGINRVLKLMKNYNNFNFSIYHTHIFRDAMNISCNVNEVTIVEIMLSTIASLHGKSKVLPIFWMARDEKRYSTYIDNLNNEYALTSILRNKKIKSTAVITDWKKYLSSENGKILEKAFNSYAKKFFSNEVSSNNLFQEMFANFIKTKVKKVNIESAHSDSYWQSFRKNIKSILPNSLIELYWFARYYFVKTNPNIRGYPWTSKSAQLAFKKMKKIIVKDAYIR